MEDYQAKRRVNFQEKLRVIAGWTLPELREEWEAAKERAREVEARYMAAGRPDSMREEWEAAKQAKEGIAFLDTELVVKVRPTPLATDSTVEEALCALAAAGELSAVDSTGHTREELCRAAINDAALGLAWFESRE